MSNEVITPPANENAASVRVPPLATGYALSPLEQAEAHRKSHVAAIYGKRLPQAPREGWAIVSQGMRNMANGLHYSRGDGWWTLEHACLYPTKEQADAVADQYRGLRPEVVFTLHNAKFRDERSSFSETSG
jgi:hypothetical protein